MEPFIFCYVAMSEQGTVRVNSLPELLYVKLTMITHICTVVIVCVLDNKGMVDEMRTVRGPV